MKQWKRMHISEELLLEAFAMPDDTRLVRISMAQIFLCGGGTIELVVEHPDFGEHVKGEEIELLNPTLTADYDKRPDTWVTFDWGLEDETNE